MPSEQGDEAVPSLRRTGKGELQGYRRMEGQMRAQQLEHTVGFFYYQEPVAIGKGLLSLSAEQFPVKSPIHGTDQPDPPWCLSWSNQMPINLSLHRDTARST